MARHLTGVKPLTEPSLTMMSDAMVSLSHNELTYQFLPLTFRINQSILSLALQQYHENHIDLL